MQKRNEYQYKCTSIIFTQINQHDQDIYTHTGTKVYLQNSSSLANASSTLEAPIRLPSVADRVVANIPITINGGQPLILFRKL